MHWHSPMENENISEYIPVSFWSLLLSALNPYNNFPLTDRSYRHRITFFVHVGNSLYYRVVVIRAPLQGLCYTVRDAVDWFQPPTTRWFQKGSNHSPLQFCWSVKYRQTVYVEQGYKSKVHCGCSIIILTAGGSCYGSFCWYRCFKG